MSTANSIVAYYITEKGRFLAQRLCPLYPSLRIVKFSAGAVEKMWHGHGGFIFIMAAGIVVRTIASLIKDKKSDPAVIVLDEAGRFAISLLSGHLGGANTMSREIAGFLEGQPVITTASDVSGLPSIDIWARDNDLAIEDWRLLPGTATRLLNSGGLQVYTDIGILLPREFEEVSSPAMADILITHRMRLPESQGLYLRPKDLVAGIGCNRGTTAEEIEAAVKKAFDDHALSFLSLCSVATIDIKAEEPGIRKFCGKYSFYIHSFTPEELNSVAGVLRSETVFRATGAKAVAEPAALLATGADKLLVSKQKIGNVTVAAAEIKEESPEWRIEH